MRGWFVGRRQWRRQLWQRGLGQWDRWFGDGWFGDGRLGDGRLGDGRLSAFGNWRLRERRPSRNRRDLWRGATGGVVGTGTGGATGGGTGGAAGATGAGGSKIDPTACSTGTAQSGDVTVNLFSHQQKITGFGVSSAWAGSFKNASDPNYLWSTTRGPAYRYSASGTVTGLRLRSGG